MARIRSIKPEFPQSETVGKLSRDARLLFIQLWTIVDDSGRARASSRMLASLLYPYDDDARGLIDGWLDELEGCECIRRYEVDGSHFLDIPNWLKHQKIDKPSVSKLPEFVEGSRTLATDLGPRKGPRTLDQDLGSSSLRSDETRTRATTTTDELETVLDHERAVAVVDHRKRLRKPLTAHAAKLLSRKFAKCPDPNAAADAMIANGWQGFDPSWLEPREHATGPPRRERVVNGFAAHALRLAEESHEPGHRQNHEPSPDPATRGARPADGDEMGDLLDAVRPDKAGGTYKIADR